MISTSSFNPVFQTFSWSSWKKNNNQNNEKQKLLTWVQVNLGKIFWVRVDLLRVDPIRLKPW